MLKPSLIASIFGFFITLSSKQHLWQNLTNVQFNKIS